MMITTDSGCKKYETKITLRKIKLVTTKAEANKLLLKNRWVWITFWLQKKLTSTGYWVKQHNLNPIKPSNCSTHKFTKDIHQWHSGVWACSGQRIERKQIAMRSKPNCLLLEKLGSYRAANIPQEKHQKDKLVTIQQLTVSDCDDWSWLVSDCISLVACDNCCVTDCRWRALALRAVSSSSEAICIWTSNTTHSVNVQSAAAAAAEKHSARFLVSELIPSEAINNILKHCTTHVCMYPSGKGTAYSGPKCWGLFIAGPLS